MAALWIANVKVTDDEIYMKYAAIAGEAIAAHGGEFIARAGRYVQLEGNDRLRNVVARFPTVEDAVACYNSERYQEAVQFAKISSERDLVVIETTE